MHAALRGGGKVAVTDIDSIRGQQLVAKIAAAGGQAAYLTQDVTDEARWPEVVAEIEDCYGRLDDVLVVNADIGIMVPSKRYDRRFSPTEIVTGTARCLMGDSLFWPPP